MPRTREQQDRHNQRRRESKQEGREAIFTMKYILTKYPEIHSEACEFFTVLDHKYPGKRDLSKTHEFIQLKDQTKNTDTIMLEPRLEINLISSSNIMITEEETPPFISMESMETDEIEKLIEELRQDPDLTSAFDNIVLEDPAMETTIVEEFLPPADAERQEIEKIVREIGEDAELISAFNDMEQFDHLGEDLPELDEVFW